MIYGHCYRYNAHKYNTPDKHNPLSILYTKHNTTTKRLKFWVRSKQPWTFFTAGIRQRNNHQLHRWYCEQKSNNRSAHQKKNCKSYLPRKLAFTNARNKRHFSPINTCHRKVLPDRIGSAIISPCRRFVLYWSTEQLVSCYNVWFFWVCFVFKFALITGKTVTLQLDDKRCKF